MNLKAGDAFFAPHPPPGDVEHLCFVISDPGKDPENVVVVPMMTWDKWKETSCLIQKGDHPFVRHTSFIDYRSAAVVSSKFIEDAVRAKRFRTHQPAPKALLSKILAGAAKSQFLQLKFLFILEEQGLVDPS